jgi:hypothetical protein
MSVVSQGGGVDPHHQEGMNNVVLLRPFAPSGSLRRLADARHTEAIDLLFSGRFRDFRDRMSDVEAIRAEAKRAERWEKSILGARLAAEGILQKAKESR